MPKGSQSNAAKLSKWKMMTAGYEKHKADISFAENDSARLKEITVKMEELEVKHEQQKAESQKTTMEISDIVAEGEKICASIMRYAKAKYGPNSLELKDFS
jgi:hypothetical protein